MASDIDETVPPDNVKASKSAIRGNFAAAKSEIEDLQAAVSLPRMILRDSRQLKEV